MEEANHREKTFIDELESEIRWEWHWEKRNRRILLWSNVGIWLSRFVVLALASYELAAGGRNPVQVWVLISIAVFAMLNVSLPLLVTVLKSHQRQEVHDHNARRYSVIRTELLAGVIPLGEAVEQFKRIRSEPTEKAVRQTP